MTNINDMKAEVKFRALSAYIGWVYGSIVYDNATPEYVWVWNRDGGAVTAKLGTECMFTGLHDGTTWADLTEAERERWTLDGNMPSEWDGRCIYDGDVLQYTAHDGYMLDSFTAEVRWIEQYACFGYCKIGLTKEGWEQPLVHPFSEHDEFIIDVLPYIKVIGNIYQNPELLSSK